MNNTNNTNRAKDKEIYLSLEGLAKLQAELDYLRQVRRPKVAERIHQAKEFGDLQENAEYETAKNEQGFIEGRILTLEKIISRAVIIDIDGNKPSSDTVEIGSKVTVISSDGQETYTIIGSAEANPSRGKISNESPVGQALLGRKIGEVISLRVPAGTVKITIAAIE